MPDAVSISASVVWILRRPDVRIICKYCPHGNPTCGRFLRRDSGFRKTVCYRGSDSRDEPNEVEALTIKSTVGKSRQRFWVETHCGPLIAQRN
jgi:hypothetical protein